MVEIIEVLRRSEHGITEPFICRGDDDEIYFVKGMGGAGRRSLVCEWICGRLAQALDLPVAPFEIVRVPPELVAFESPLKLEELGPGPAFGSRQRHVTEITIEAAAEVPEALRRDILLFDWWIKNGDRSLSARGGNPNLFWEPDARELVVIDHNVAFDTDLIFDNFIQYHIFKEESPDVFGDFVRRHEYTDRLSSALGRWEAICADIPPEWLYLDAEMLDPISLDLDAVHALLGQFEGNDFWNWR